MITQETGKLTIQAKNEIDNCLQHLQWLIENSEKVLKDEEYRLLNGRNAGVMTQPLGPLLVLTPYSSPFWIPFKACISPMILGNSILLKHSDTTPMCALALERLFIDAGFDKGEF